MLFSTYTFAAFFAAVWLLDRALPTFGARKLALLLASYIFYASWNWPFAGLLFLSTFVDFNLAARIARTEAPGPRRALLVVSLILNLGLLAFFKYADLALATVEDVVGLGGLDLHLPRLDLALPLGISFYTFHTLSYVLDVYRRRAPCEPRFGNFALYVAFFPQLVAGPIVRASELLPQLAAPPAPRTTRRLNEGLCLILWGLFKKVAVADPMGQIADQVFAAPGDVGALGALAGTTAFAVQIYCDFSGYSHMALGLARLLGFTLPENFHHPYGAIGFSDFWRRWHMTLSRWLRDYLYVPLGGNRGSPTKTARNLMLTMLIGGLWHGAHWNFVVWGGLHGLYLVAERRLLRALGVERAFRAPGGLRGFVFCCLTFALVLVTWIFFRATHTTDALVLLAALFGADGLTGSATPPLRSVALALTATAALVVSSYVFRERRLLEVLDTVPPRRLALAAALLLVLTFHLGGQSRAFIYFEF